MSRRCQTARTFAKKQRIVALAREWDSFTEGERNLCIRRLSTRKQVRKARANAGKIAKATAQPYTEAELAELMKAAA